MRGGSARRRAGAAPVGRRASRRGRRPAKPAPASPTGFLGWLDAAGMWVMMSARGRRRRVQAVRYPLASTMMSAAASVKMHTSPPASSFARAPLATDGAGSVVDVGGVRRRRRARVDGCVPGPSRADDREIDDRCRGVCRDPAAAGDVEPGDAACGGVADAGVLPVGGGLTGQRVEQSCRCEGADLGAGLGIHVGVDQDVGRRQREDTHVATAVERGGDAVGDERSGARS